jgi:hypothetical protein
MKQLYSYGSEELGEMAKRSPHSFIGLACPLMICAVAYSYGH